MKMPRRVAGALIALLAIASFADVALAQAPPAVPPDAWTALGDGAFYKISLRALVILFVMAILIESALAVIFNWRLFLELFYGRGVKTLVMIAVSALAVWTFNIDVVHTMLTSYGLVSAGEGPTFSRWLTALILAGGSSGVYSILVKLGYRQERTEAEVKPRPKKDKAWISVKVRRRTAVGPVLVRVTEAGDMTTDGIPQLAGVVAPRGVWATIVSVFFLDRDRFPPAGGWELIAAKQYRIEVTGRDADGEPVNADLNGTYAFAPGAIIDFTARL